MIFPRGIWFAFLATVVSTTPAYSWGGDGHRIVCAIAWDELTPEVQDKVKTLLNLRFREQFADTCLWADEYRDSGHRETATWHYVNVPPGATSVDMTRDCSALKSCVVEQVNEKAKALRAGGPDATEALKYLAHFVGDIHQPLHVGQAEDRGGNEIKGKYFGQETNLHVIWDTLLIEHENMSWPQLVVTLEKEISPDQRKRWVQSQPIDWANESLAIALDPATHYTAKDKGFNFGAEYERKERPVVYERLSSAGVRLGQFLNMLLAK